MTNNGPMMVPHGLKFQYRTHIGPIWALCPDSAHMGPIWPYLLGSFTFNIYVLNSTYFIFNQFKSKKFARFVCCLIYTHHTNCMKLNTH